MSELLLLNTEWATPPQYLEETSCNRWHDDDVRFILDQHVRVGFFHSASSLKQKTAGRFCCLTNPANVWSSFWPPDYTMKKSDVINLCVLRWHFRYIQWPTRPCKIFYDTRMKHSKRFTTVFISCSLRLIVFIFPDH